MELYIINQESIININKQNNKNKNKNQESRIMYSTSLSDPPQTLQNKQSTKKKFILLVRESKELLAQHVLKKSSTPLRMHLTQSLRHEFVTIPQIHRKPVAYPKSEAWAQKKPEIEINK